MKAHYGLQQCLKNTLQIQVVKYASFYHQLTTHTACFGEIIHFQRQNKKKTSRNDKRSVMYCTVHMWSISYKNTKEIKERCNIKLSSHKRKDTNELMTIKHSIIENLFRHCNPISFFLCSHIWILGPTKHPIQ